MVRRPTTTEQAGQVNSDVYELAAPDSPALQQLQAASSGTDNGRTGLPPSYGDVLNEPPSSYPAEKSSHTALQSETIDADDDSSSGLGSDYAHEFEDDEEDWALDEAAAQLTSAGLPTYEESEHLKAGQTIDDLVRHVVAGTTSTGVQGDIKQKPSTVKPLECPVVIPQRRPRENAHGFVQAYSPLLTGCGIEQDTFLRFLTNFHKATQHSPVFPAIEVAIDHADMDVATTAMAVTIIASAAAGIGPADAQRPQGFQINHFMDRMNDELFQPAGLYALIVKMAPAAGRDATSAANAQVLPGGLRFDYVNFSTSTESMPMYNRPEDAKKAHDLQKGMQDMHISNESHRGSPQCATTAPLVFPALDRLLTTGIPGVVNNSLRGVEDVVSEYLERRTHMRASRRPSARREYQTHEHAEVPSLVSWATNGAYNPRQRIRDRRVERHLQRDVRRLERGRGLKHERAHERRYGEAYFDELRARTDEHRDITATTHHDYARAEKAGPSGRDDRRRHGSGKERGILAGTLVSGLLGVAASTVSQATGNGKLLAGSLVAGSLGFAANTVAHATGSARYPSGQPSSSQTHRTMPDSDGDRSDRNLPGADHGHHHASYEDHVQAGMVRRVMQEHVLYLMVVNMPTEIEMSRAWDELDKAGFA